tara:strand:+ start:420 stop:746 length:327 start_codon:yes stop_codon:yes gene_type:complete
MTQKEFDKIKTNLSHLSHEIMEGKRPEYTNESLDVLQNFKNTANKLNISPLKVWSVFFDKQLQSIFTHTCNASLKKSETIESRFCDVINYCYLGYALFLERDNEKKNN